MGLPDWLPGVEGDEDPESKPGSHRCLRCQAFHDRAHHSCPDCGSQFVAPIDPDTDTDSDPDPDDDAGPAGDDTDDDVRRLPEDSEWKYG